MTSTQPMTLDERKLSLLGDYTRSVLDETVEVVVPDGLTLGLNRSSSVVVSWGSYHVKVGLFDAWVTSRSWRIGWSGQAAELGGRNYTTLQAAVDAINKARGNRK